MVNSTDKGYAVLSHPERDGLVVRFSLHLLFGTFHLPFVTFRYLGGSHHHGNQVVKVLYPGGFSTKLWLILRSSRELQRFHQKRIARCSLTRFLLINLVMLLTLLMSFSKALNGGLRILVIMFARFYRGLKQNYLRKDGYFRVNSAQKLH